jgi:cell wall-associated NlpC family hydrolase
LTKKTERKKKENQKLADNIIDSASENLGVPLDLGTTTNGYDCSGLVFSTFF